MEREAKRIRTYPASCNETETEREREGKVAGMICASFMR